MGDKSFALAMTYYCYNCQQLQERAPHGTCYSCGSDHIFANGWLMRSRQARMAWLNKIWGEKKEKAT
jgi:rRNA maturation endonuclease Nob1